MLPTYAPSLGQEAVRSLEKLGVAVRMDTRLKRIDEGCVTLESDAGNEQIQTETVLWGAGVQGSSLGRTLAQATGAETDRQGRVLVQPDLSVRGYPNVFVLGDLAHFRQQDHPLPGVAPVAMQQGAYAARLIRNRLRGRRERAFSYTDRGSMAVIGRAAAVAQIGRAKFHGIGAWLIWLFIHLMYLVEFENRILVLTQWGWNYFTRNRSARLITQWTGRPSGGAGSMTPPSQPSHLAEEIPRPGELHHTAWQRPLALDR